MIGQQRSWLQSCPFQGSWGFKAQRHAEHPNISELPFQPHLYLFHSLENSNNVQSHREFSNLGRKDPRGSTHFWKVATRVQDTVSAQGLVIGSTRRLQKLTEVLSSSPTHLWFTGTDSFCLMSFIQLSTDTYKVISIHLARKDTQGYFSWAYSWCQMTLKSRQCFSSDRFPINFL